MKLKEGKTLVRPPIVPIIIKKLSDSSVISQCAWKLTKSIKSAILFIQTLGVVQHTKWQLPKLQTHLNDEAEATQKLFFSIYYSWALVPRWYSNIKKVHSLSSNLQSQTLLCGSNTTSRDSQTLPQRACRAMFGYDDCQNNWDLHSILLAKPKC